MKNNLFNAVRLITEKKALNNDLKSIQSRATELNRKAQINPIGQIQIPLYELRGVISDSGATKINGYEITPTTNVISRARYLEGLSANAKYPIFRGNCSQNITILFFLDNFSNSKNSNIFCVLFCKLEIMSSI